MKKLHRGCQTVYDCLNKLSKTEFYINNGLRKIRPDEFFKKKNKEHHSLIFLIYIQV